MLTITKDNIEKDGIDTNEEKVIVEATRIELTGETTVTGNTKVTGTLNSTDKLTVESNGADIKGGLTISSGSLTIPNGGGGSFGGGNVNNIATLSCTNLKCANITVSTSMTIAEV